MEEKQGHVDIEHAQHASDDNHYRRQQSLLNMWTDRQTDTRTHGQTNFS